MKAYDVELRKRAIAYYEQSGHKVETCRIFQLSRPTLDRWLAQQAEQGHLEPKTNYQTGYGHKVTDLDEFRQWVSEQSFERVVDLIDPFERHYGIEIKERNLLKWLHRAGYRFKKKP
jgi:transposase